MASAPPDPRAYFTEHLPAQFERALRAQERAVQEAERVLAGMRGVDTTIVVEVHGEGGGRFVLNVDGGRLTPGDAPAHPPVMTLIQERRDFERLIRDAGNSALGFLGGLSGLAGEIKLTRDRLGLLAGLAGTLRFRVTGDDGFCVLTHFGAGAPKEPPDTEIRVAPDVYADLQAGRLDAQSAFMSGKLELEGDMQLAMQLALAAMSPD
jgi:putative sterol carrier protein